MKLEICAFSGKKIYPGHGILYVRSDSRSFRFVDSKSKNLFLNAKNPRKLHWTALYRRMNRKGITTEAAKKRTRRTVKAQRAIVGTSLDAIKAQRAQAPEVRAAARQAAISAAKDKKKADAAAKKAEKAKAPKDTAAKQQQKVGKLAQRGAKPAPVARSR
ncbi:hypothetical protein GQ42DRAFT_136129 [Ramicandelaber brevisporus]|nr:hypothetical protein GQ42DRAFT_136129 [Ramicandelaber brevisporus]